MQPLFELGKTYATSGITRWAANNGLDLARYLRRHHCGDKSANESALEHGTRIFSAYVVNDRKIYVITEADRSITTLLFAEEY